MMSGALGANSAALPDILILCGVRHLDSACRLLRAEDPDQSAECAHNKVETH